MNNYTRFRRIKPPSKILCPDPPIRFGPCAPAVIIDPEKWYDWNNGPNARKPGAVYLNN